ncbi:YjfB family protein [Lonsdalea quercina]|uniref:Putative motility protein n=1 Tax=Lonsdalea quercina TaxID=71657 RepID=A0A1H3ZHN3_9GAMM|nr:YjfB family protein [Lonsdalea quercina]SEA22921.1 Putative motility protein [Lonsdalea quercina]
MDVSQIASLATRVDNQELSRRVSTTLLKKTSDNQESTAANLLESIPSLPANPAVGRNINTTA